jgi:N-methylhydantoinase A
MARALRVVTVERGVDPRGYALIAFGGAGPMHAVRLAEELEMGLVLCPRAAGVLSAAGLVVSEARRDFARSVLLGEDAVRSGQAAAAARELAARARRELPGARIEAAYDVRYRGQAFELTVAGPLEPSLAGLRERFEAAHRERYGYADDDGELELVNVRVAATAARPGVRLAGEGPPEPVREGTRTAAFAGARVEAQVLRGEPAPGTALAGPAILELPEATAVVPPGWHGRVDEHGTLLLERDR